MSKKPPIWKSKPYVFGLSICVFLVGFFCGLIFMPEDWPLWRKICAGALTGVGSALILISNRIIS